jgi:NADP-dependent 3-hydroxy acid dehydrogenase YdfG
MTNEKRGEAQIHTQVESLKEKRVVISGGTSGIGKATAVLLGSYGARLLIFGLHEENLRSAMAEIESAGGSVVGLTADQADPDDVKRVFAAADEKLGGIDILINNAAAVAGQLADTDDKTWRYVVQTNVMGYMACSREAVLRMKKGGGGHIVNVGSMSADLREPQSIYVTTKAAIQAFSESLRKEVNDDGIKVSLIEPGLTRSNLTGLDQEQQEGKIGREEMVKAKDIAVGIHYIVTQPKRLDVVVLQLRPHRQKI